MKTALTFVLSLVLAAPAFASDPIKEWQEQKRFGLGAVNAISSSPDGTRIAVATGLGIFIRVAATQQVERVLTGHSALVSAVAWSPDGKRIASGSYDRTAKIWDAQTGALLLSMTAPSSRRGSGAIRSLAWSPDSAQLAGGGAVHAPVLIWDAATGVVRKSLSCRPGSRFSYCVPRALAWSPDGTRLASAVSFVYAPSPLVFTGFRGIPIWDVASGTLVTTLVDDRFVGSLAWSPDGSKLALGIPLQDAAPGRIVEIWDVASHAIVRTLKGHTGGVNAVAWTDRGIVSASDDLTVRLWDPATGATVRTLHAGSAAYALSTSADGSQIAAATGDQQVEVWSADTGALVNTLRGHTVVPESVSWSPDRTRVAAAYYEGVVRIWDVATGTVLRTLRGHRNLVLSVAWSPDGSRIASGSSDGRIKIWNAETGRLRRTLTGHSRYVDSVAWSPDGVMLVSGGGDSSIRIWDAERGRLVRTMGGDQVVVTSVSWSPDGARIASGDLEGATVDVWDARTGALQATLEGHYNFIEAVAWSPDSKRIASAALDSNINSQVKIWDAATGNVLRTLRSPQSFIALAWSPDGARLATGSRDALIRVWDGETGKLQKILAGHLDDITSVAWSSNGQNLASAAYDGTVRIWGASDESHPGAAHVATSPAADPPGQAEAEEAMQPPGGTAAPGGVSLQAAGNYPLGGNSPAAMVVADLNGDGILDIATANVGSADVSILLGNRDGTFRPAPGYVGAGLLPQGIATGDFNRDGIPDLVVAQFGNSFSVLLGNGDGTFQPAHDYQPGCCSPSGVAVGDFDHDGILDLAVTMANESAVAIYRGVGDGTFTFLGNVPVGFGPRDVVARDLNGDGILDLAVVSSGLDYLIILLGNGDGTFRAWEKAALPGGAFASHIIAGDFNGDGIVDLATPNPGRNSVSVLLGKGDGTFQPVKEFGAGSVPFGIGAGAFSRRTRSDGSAILDLATANPGTPFEVVAAGSLASVSLLQGTGDGTFRAGKDLPAGAATYVVGAGDFNGDGAPDIAAANGLSSDVSILINTTPLPSTSTAVSSK